MSKPQVGDRVSVLVPGNWERRGIVVKTDYHPLGIDDAVKVMFDDNATTTRPPEWWDTRWVKRVT